MARFLALSETTASLLPVWTPEVFVSVHGLGSAISEHIRRVSLRGICIKQLLDLLIKQQKFFAKIVKTPTDRWQKCHSCITHTLLNQGRRQDLLGGARFKIGEHMKMTHAGGLG